MRNLPVFDTHFYVKRLQSVGVDEQQAETHAELQSQVLSMLITDKIATKEDLSSTKNELKAEIAELRSDLKIAFAELSGRITALDIKLNGKLAVHNWMLASVVATTVLPTLYKWFQHI